MAKIPKKQRLLKLEKIINNMHFLDVITFACITEGIDRVQLEKEVGEMSMNQWRNLLYENLCTSLKL